jgi:C-terminal processing protease CtpA/Prc
MSSGCLQGACGSPLCQQHKHSPCSLALFCRSRRTVILGERTFGKGLVQDYFAEPDGSGLELTVAKYLTPSGWDVSELGGIQPGVVCHDYPRGPVGPLDDCIMEALRVIDGAQQQGAAAAPAED